MRQARGTKKKSESPTVIEAMTSHRARSLSIELRELMVSKATLLGSHVIGVLHTARIGSVHSVLHGDNVPYVDTG